MNNRYSYSMKQVQKLAMTQDMKLSINILQMSSEELNEFMEKEFVDNPLIEINENLPVNIKEIDFDFVKCGKNNIKEDVSPLNFISKEKSLRDYLHEQILEVEADKIIRKTADYLVECLNYNGYFDMEVEEVAEKISVNIDVVNKSLKLLQSLEPYGIAARNLEECLLIQIKRLNIKDEKIIQIVKNNLKDIGNDDYLKIAKDLKITRAEAQRYSMIIRNLEPKPSRGFYTGEDYKYIIPDAEIRKVGETLEIIMNEKSLPQFIVSNTYKNMFQKGENVNAGQYVKDKLSRAELLIKSIEERKNTLKKILEYIVVRQYEYFMQKEKFLKPMTIKDTAQDLGFSESTVSRAVKNKFVLTAFGVLRMKDLFTINTIKNTSKDISVDYIKNLIEQVISKEDKKSPISDQEIVEKLKAKDIEISRRTIAKYREEMGIKSSRKRKIF
ncbi:MAG: RNA polymerase factor sigma-54 [Clostridium sp.]|nr:RNA polymerase factor sigma-54 [Clostridium sp.]